MAFKSLVFSTLLFVLSTSANAIVLNFDDIPLGSLGGSFNQGVNSYNGFDFYNPNGNTTIYSSGYSGSQSYLNGNGGNTTITKSDGGLFSFEGFWTKAFNCCANSFGEMGILGYLDGNLVATQGFTATSTWTHVAAIDSGFSKIDTFTLLFYGGNGYSDIRHRYIDDINFGDVSAVPEPGILALMALGLAGVGIRRLKK